MKPNTCHFVCGSDLWNDCKDVAKMFRHTELTTFGNFKHSLVTVDVLEKFIVDNAKNYGVDEINHNHIGCFIEKLKTLKSLDSETLVDLEN